MSPVTPAPTHTSSREPTVTFSFCLVSSEMPPLGESRVGVGGVTVISGGNLVVAEGMTSFGMLGRRRDLARPGSALPGGPSGGWALPLLGTLELTTVGWTLGAEPCLQLPRPDCPNPTWASRASIMGLFNDLLSPLNNSSS